MSTLTGKEPVFAYDNIFWRSGASITSSSEDATPLADPGTAEKWAPSDATPYVEVSGYGDTDIDFIAVAAHNIGTLGGSVELQSFDGSTWNTIQTITPADDSVAALKIPVTFLSTFRVKVPQNAEIGVLYVGPALIPSRTIYGGHNPAVLHPEYKLTVDNGGNHYAGQVSRRSTLSTNIKVSNIPAQTVRSFWDLFRDHFNSCIPFFFHWRPSTYSEECVYAWRSGSAMNLRNSGPRDLMDVSMSIRAYDGV